MSGSSASSNAVSRYALGARKPRGRLVEHQQPRLGHQRHAHLELALLAVREVGHEGHRAARPARPASPSRRAFSRRASSLPDAHQPQMAAGDAERGQVEVVLDGEAA